MTEATESFCVHVGQCYEVVAAGGADQSEVWWELLSCGSSEKKTIDQRLRLCASADGECTAGEYSPPPSPPRTERRRSSVVFRV